MRIPIIALLALAPSAVFAQDVPLQAGIARVDITPAEFAPMYGYANRKCGPAAGMHDPLYAKALVLSAGGGRVAIVTLDLGSIVSSRLGEEAAKLNIPVLLLAASHTHSGPNFLAQSGGTDGATPYLAAVEDK